LKKGKAIRIFDDWFGNRFEEEYQIKAINFNKENQLLILQLNEDKELRIQNPRLIMEAKTYLKILKADGVEIQWMQMKKDEEQPKRYFQKYEVIDDEKIQNSTNVDWFKPHFDVSLGKPALLIYD